MNEKVLVVDHEASLRDFYKLELTNEGFDITIADSGNDALARINNYPVDVVILEIELPDGSGLDYLPQFMKANRDVKVIINTDYPGYKLDFRSWIADAFLTKSLDLTLLKKTIKRLLLAKRTCGRKEDVGRTVS